ncbi:MAG: SMC family ATPase [Candidatus Bathyarchaeota archaeon]|nr:SMC family ATPase [Candidatus Bathyarchaeota archaeon]
MKIEVVQLENIRSHVKSTIPFTRGFNCLLGGVGTGKSSVLYALDFALFGEPLGRSFEYLLREDADSGRITVQFSQNGRPYRIVRGLKRRGKGISQDLEELKLYEDEKLLAGMKTDAVAEQIKAITGLDRELYREIMWVRQEHLKELLDAAPRDRQRRLDELFGLSDYEAAWSNIAVYQRDYETEKKVYEKDVDVVGLEKLSVEYNRITEEFMLLEMELQDAVSKLAAAKRALDAADEKLKALEEKKLLIEELRRKEAKVQANIASIKETLASLSRRVEDKKTIIANLKQRQNSLNSQATTYKQILEQAGVFANQPVEALRGQLAAFDDKLASLRAEQEATLRNLRADQKRTESLALESRCPLCLQQLNSEYKNGLMQRIQQENLERQRIIEQLQSEIEKLQRTKAAVNEAVSNLQTLTTRAEELKARLNEEERNLSELIAEIEAKRQLEVDLTGQLEALRFEIGRFDLSDLEAARAQREQAFRQYYRLESELRTKENRKKDLLARLDEVKERIDHAQEKLERMQKITRTLEVLSAIRDAYRSIQPKLRSEFIKVLRNFVQQVLDSLVAGEAPLLNVIVDETYTPYVKSESGVERDVANLSGGERTLLAFAYRLGLGQLIMQSRTGHSLSMLLLDEPTESLGSEDGSIDRLAEAISRFKAIEQIIAVTHSEAFAEKAEHVIVLEKEAGISRISLEK